MCAVLVRLLACSESARKSSTSLSVMSADEVIRELNEDMVDSTVSNASLSIFRSATPLLSSSRDDCERKVGEILSLG